MNFLKKNLKIITDGIFVGISLGKSVGNKKNIITEGYINGMKWVICFYASV